MLDFSKNYDMRSGLDQAVLTLENFNALLNERHVAGYNRNERLREWIVLGRYYLDSCGNVMKYVDRDIPAELFPKLPLVLTPNEFNTYMKNHHLEWEKLSFSCSMGSDIPPAKIICPECSLHWNIKNCHDTVVIHEDIKIDLTHWVGLRLKDLKEVGSLLIHCIWRLSSGKYFRNASHINLSIVDSEQGRKYKWKINESGWFEPSDNYIITPGDEAFANVWTYRHLKCHRDRQARLEREYFEKIFTEAGYSKVQLKQVKNQYCGCTSCAPWYEVIADGLPFTIGWRKRVIEIQSTDTRISFVQTFPDENVTKEKSYIHAWGRAKCLEYLQKVKYLTD